jgi:hypothetical protein
METTTHGTSGGQAESPARPAQRPGKPSRGVLIWMALAGVLVALLFGGLLPRYLRAGNSLPQPSSRHRPARVNVIRVEPAPLRSLSSFREMFPH